MILLPGCFCCKQCELDTDFTRPSSLSLAITVVSNAASSSAFGPFSGVKSSYTLDKNSSNPSSYYYNAAPGTNVSFNDVNITSFLSIGQFNKYTLLTIRFPTGHEVAVLVECYAGVLSARGSIPQGSGSPGDPTNVAVTIQGVAFNPTYTLLSAASPILPVRVFGTMGYRSSTTAPWTSIPVDFTVTGWLPFEEMT